MAAQGKVQTPKIANQIKHGGFFNRYAHMNFPPYKFKEFPKHVAVDGKTHLVNSREEEAQAIGSGKKAKLTLERAAQ